MSTLSREEIAHRLPSLNGWTLDGDAIKKQMRVPVGFQKF